LLTFNLVATFHQVTNIYHVHGQREQLSSLEMQETFCWMIVGLC